jgi:hypothetical protein
MPISKLVENPAQPVEVQETTFSIDVLGRYICSTWDEAVNNGGAPFDVVVIGAGMFGAYIAEKIYRKGESGNLRVLVLDAGSFLVSEHVQNLSRIGLNAAGPVTVDPGTPRERVWGLPWRSKEGFPGLAYCLGGRSIYWGGWAPRLTDADLAHWPAELKTLLGKTFPSVEKEIGVDPSTDYIRGPLYKELKTAFDTARPTVSSVDKIEDAPLAVQGKSPASGLFSFDKFSSAPILVDAIREAASKPDLTRRLFLVPKCHVTRLHTSAGAVTGIEAVVNGQPKFLTISPATAVVVASSTIESTRLALESFPTPLMGKNLVAHLRSNTIVRINRKALPPTLPKELQAAALLVRGSTPNGRYHLQVTAAAVQGANSEATMWRMVPDIDLQDQIVKGQKEDWIVITLRGIGEMLGDKAADPSNSATSWLNLSPFERDEFNARRAWVNLVARPEDNLLWKTMDDAAMALAQKIAGSADNIEYFYDNAWSKVPPPAGKVHDKLGTTHHEAGTLWMGADPATSVTDLGGRFHHVVNAYVAGPALFPTLGSANPTLTGLSLARHTADRVVEDLLPKPEPGFTALLDSLLPSLKGWQMAGAGGFRFVGRNILESDGGIGLLWYTQQQFGDFVLKVDWRANNPDDNSGVFLRFPALGSGDPANDWKLAVDQGYEVQIDDTGKNPDTNTFNDPLHETGAIYKLAPASKLASKPLGQWNTYEIQAVGDSISVSLNGSPVSQLKKGNRPKKGFVGLQNHHTGSRVQFRNVRIKQL